MRRDHRKIVVKDREQRLIALIKRHPKLIGDAAVANSFPPLNTDPQPVVIEYIDVNAAMKLVFQAGYGNVSRVTLHKWLRDYALGKKIGGRWKVDKARFKRFLEKGTPE